MGEPVVSVVVAAARNGVIGRGGALPWQLRSDLRAFRRLTMGHPVIMGRKTFESIGKPLDGRDNIVVTGGAAPQGTLGAASVAEALAAATRIARERGLHKVFVIGGAQIYAATLPLAQRVHLTEVQADVEGDAAIVIPGTEWREVRRENCAAGKGDEFDYAFVILERRGG